MDSPWTHQDSFQVILPKHGDGGVQKLGRFLQKNMKNIFPPCDQILPSDICLLQRKTCLPTVALVLLGLKSIPLQGMFVPLTLMSKHWAFFLVTFDPIEISACWHHLETSGITLVLSINHLQLPTMDSCRLYICQYIQTLLTYMQISMHIKMCTQTQLSWSTCHKFTVRENNKKDHC